VHKSNIVGRLMKIAATFLGEENSIMGMMTDKYVLKNSQSIYSFLAATSSSFYNNNESLS